MTPRFRHLSFALLLCLLLPGVPPAGAQEPLGDLATPGEWVPHQWNSARGRIAPSPEFPEGVEAPPGERRSLSVQASWGGDGEFRFFNVEPRARPAPIPFRVLGVSLWVKGSGTEHAVEVHFDDGSGKDAKIGLGTTASTEWRRLSARVPAEMAQPLRLRSVTFHNWSARQAMDTTFRITRLGAVVDRAQRVVPGEDTPAFTLSSDAENGLAPDTGRVTLTLKLSAWDPGERALEVGERLTDWEGKTVSERRTPVALKGRWSQTATLDLPRCGSFSYAAEVRDPATAKVVASLGRRFARAVSVRILPAKERARSPMGVNGHQGSPWATLGRLGIHWGRDYSWGWLEYGKTAPQGKGVDFLNLWKDADAAGVTLLPILQGAFRNPANTGFVEDAGAVRDAYARLAKALPDVPYWELDNEAEYGFPGRRFNLPNYRAYIAAAADGLRAAQHGQVALNGTAGIRYDDTAALLKSPVRGDFAVVNYHYYTGTVPPELATEDINVGGEERRETLSFLDQMRRINRLAHSAGKESWLTEIGWDVTNAPAVGERLQAVYLPQVYLLARLSGTEKVFWYYDRDVPGSKERFGTCGLIDVNGDVRPSGVAMAALSRFTAQAEVAGSVDLGEDQWCVLLREAKGDWVAAVWSVEKPHPLPKELAGAEAFDLFGNPARPAQTTPGIAYFRLAKLPAAWEAQRQVEWLALNTLVAVPGGAVEAGLRSPDPATAVSWESLPKGVTAAAWVRKGDGLVGALTCAPDLVTGAYPIQVSARGAGWGRRWPLTLAVLPPVKVAAEPYTPGDLALLHLRAAMDTPGIDTRIVTAPESATVLPSTVALVADKERAVAILPAPTARGALPVSLQLASGARQEVWLRPRVLAVPRVAGIAVDARLEEWPQAARLEGRCFASATETPPGEAWVGWSPEGLWLGARLTVKDLRAGDPRQFWETTNLELVVDASGEESEGWGAAAHQFWLCPVRNGDGWRLYAGEWKRGGAVAATIYDDQRPKTALRYEAGTLSIEALFPPEALGGRVPKPGDAWRAGISMRSQGATEAVEAAWPRLKANGLMDGPARWGELGFTER